MNKSRLAKKALPLAFAVLLSAATVPAVMNVSAEETPQEPQVSFIGDYGTQVGESFQKDGMWYRNFENGYAMYYRLGEENQVCYYANRNISSETMSATLVDKAVYMQPINNRSVDANAWASSGEETADALKAKIISAAETSFEKGFALGVPCSEIKVWDGKIVLDFKLGDGRFSFGGDRYNMSFIVYNPSTEGAYAVVNYSTIWANSTSLGLPCSEIKKDGSFKMNGAHISYAWMQQFDNGIVYTTKDGMVITELSLRYDETAESFAPYAAPSAPKQYGKEIKRTDSADGKHTYISYEKGCITATKNADGYYTYQLHPGRRFAADGTLTFLPLNDLIKKSDIKIDTAVDYGITESELRNAIYAGIEEYYNAGYFIGFLEDKFKPWNDIDAMQFIWGDSTADPFKEEGRKHVAALVLNRNTKALYALRDEALNAWNENYHILGYPLGNSKYYADQGISIQEFDIGIIVIDGVQAYFVSGETPTTFLAGYQKIDVPTHGKDPAKGYIVASDKNQPEAQALAFSVEEQGQGQNTGYIVGGVIGAIVIAAGIATGVTILLKRRNGDEKK